MSRKSRRYWQMNALGMPLETGNYSDVIMITMASQNTSVSIVCSTACSCADWGKHQSSALLALCEGNSPVTGEFATQRAKNAEKAFIWWRHHVNPGMPLKCDHEFTLNMAIGSQSSLKFSWAKWKGGISQIDTAGVITFVFQCIRFLHVTSWT